jgi:hypothetical protein
VAEPEDKRAPGRAEAVRSAAVQAFQSTAGQAGLTRERAQELADEAAAGEEPAPKRAAKANAKPKKAS